MNNVSLDWVMVGLSSFLTVTQTNEVFQSIQLVLTIIIMLATLASTVMSWFNKAKKDGKITVEELKELIDDLGKLNNSIGDENNGQLKQTKRTTKDNDGENRG